VSTNRTGIVALYNYVKKISKGVNFLGLSQLNEKEQMTAVVYGDTFGLYDEETFDGFVAPFYTRLKNNGIRTDVFKGKCCLDAGCGGGRGSILMAQCGAKEVVGVDFSPRTLKAVGNVRNKRDLRIFIFTSTL